MDRHLQEHAFIQKWLKNARKYFYSFVAMYCLTAGQYDVLAQQAHTTHTHGSREEVLWESIDFNKLQQDVITATGLAPADQDLFFINYIAGEKYPDDMFYFFKRATTGEINETNLVSYIEELKKKYIALYPEFQKNKKQFSDKINKINARIAVVNGPCTNIDFENGTRSGWDGATGTACRAQTPCNPVNGFSATRHVITNKTMTDPYIPGLSMVAPGGNFSLRLEDYEKGAKAAIASQTFMVTASNNLFTYQYAAVLEDPGDHDDEERPYFKVRMYDQKGNEIKCASYTAIANPPIQNYKHVKIKDPDGDPNADKDLYYRDWSTVSIPLTNYIGQNVTITFTASDCSKGAHLGYAYIDGACSVISPTPPTTICSGSTADLKATDGFASYLWSGPGIIGSNKLQTIKVNKPGTYTVKLTPFADNPCPITHTVVVSERCLPKPIKINLCESTKGSGKVAGVNLLNYNTNITAYHAAPVSVKSWHSAFPATLANTIPTPSSLTVTSASKFFAVIDYGGLGRDTAELGFTINGLPTVIFPDIAPVCKGTATFQITGLAPAGGIFSGTGVTTTGKFNPATAGSFPVKYLYTDANGCKDSLTKPAVVQAPPTVNAGPDQTLCASTATIALTGTRTIAKGAHWSGGAGTYTPHADSVITTYTPTSTEKSQSSLTLTLTSTGNGYCPAVTDDVKITFIPIPTVNAGPDQTLCASATSVTLDPKSTNSSSISWTGGTGKVSTDLKTYTPAASEITSGTVTLKLTANGNTPCAATSDDVKITFIPVPTVNAGPDQTLCASAASVTLDPKSTNSSSMSWTGGTGTVSADLKTYTPASSEITSGTVTLKLTANGNTPCAAISDDVKITFIPTPTVNAGPDQTLCASTSSVTLDPKSTNSSSMSWSGGNGTISVDKKTYTPAAAEITSGTVTLKLTANGNTPCPAVTDDITIKFISVPTVNAGPDQTLCASTTSVTLDPKSTYSSMSWTGGTGTVSTDLKTYTPAATEITSGSLILKLTANGNAPCPAISDDVKITFIPVPTVNAGPDQTLCNTVTSVMLNPKSTNSSGMNWTGGSGTMSTDLKTYTPAAAEIAAGIVHLKLTANGNTPCTTVTDDVIIRFSPLPTVNAGPDQTLCATATTVTLDPQSTNSSSITWTGGNGTVSTDFKTYTPTPAEIKNGSVILKLTANGNAPCTAVTDDMTVIFIPAPTVNAGQDIVACIDKDTVSLSAIVSNMSTGLWSGGTGTFSDAANVNTTYIPSSAEIQAGTATLTFTNTGKIPCTAVKDDLLFSIIKLPAADAGPDFKLCKDSLINLKTTAVAGIKYVWQNNGSTIGTGNSVNYMATAGNSTILLTATDTYGCHSSDTALVNSIKIPDLTLDGPYCYAKGLLLHASLSHQVNGVIEWTRNNQKISGQSQLTLPVSESGTYTVQFSFGSCVKSEKTEVFPLPVLNQLKDITLCEGIKTSLITKQIQGGVYKWKNNTGELTGNGNTYNFTIVPGIQKYYVQVSDVHTCTATDSALVTGIALPRVSMHDVVICAGATAQLNAMVSNLSQILPYNPVYIWKKDGQQTGSTGNSLNTTQAGVYNVTVNAQKCEGTAQASVKINPLPQVHANGLVKFCQEKDHTSILDAGTGYRYHWSTNDTSKTISVSAPGIYTFTITNEYQCSAPGKVELKDICPPRLFVADAFTPDGDGSNDLYNVYSVHVGDFHMLIFNRWGEIIFESKNKTHVWDGIYKDAPMESGVYPWVITYEGDSQEYKGPYNLKGSVTLVR